MIKEKYSLINASISKLNKEDYPFISTAQINEIIQKLNQKKLKVLDNKIKNLTKESASNGWEPITKNIKLLKNKIVKIYIEFIISPENTFNELKRNFDIKDKIDIVNYINNANYDIIYKDNILYYGKYNKNSNSYEIKYIFEFESENLLYSEIDDINRDIENYIKKNTVLKENNIDDKISPIFSENKIIGNIYKYNEMDCDYSNYFDYSKFIKNEKLSAFISLYNYFNKFQNNLNKSGYKTDKYYLINYSAISEIKNNCNYDQLKQVMSGKLNLDIQDMSNEKEFLRIIKNIPKNILETYFSQNNKIKKISKGIIEPENKYIINQNTNFNANIYDNFGIIDKKVAESFIEGINSYDNLDKIVFDCTLINEKVIIEYKTNLENSKYVCVIGSIDPNNLLITNKYALLYFNKIDYISHIESLKKNLNNFLQGLQLYRGTQPIIDNNYKEIGTLIKIQQSIVKLNPINRKENLEPNSKSNNENEYNLFSNLGVTSIAQYFTYPLLIGLDNIGATCYMNATLQCFCNIEKFVNYFKYNKHLINSVRNDINKKKLSSAFKLLIEKLWPDNYKQNKVTHYAPYNFNKLIISKNPIFGGVEPNDSKDLINFIIMTLHEELNKANNNINVNMIPSFPDQRNQQLMLNNFIMNFKATNQSIISDLFYALNCSMTQCFSCGSVSFNYQTYFFMLFPLEEVQQHKLSIYNQFNNYINMFNNSEINIYDCFEFSKKIIHMSEENAMFCNYCKQTCYGSICTVLTTGPEILIIIIKREKLNKVKINFVENLNLSNYIQFANTGVNYDLIGIISQLGENGLAGHFIAFCKNPISKAWFKYNDAIVTPVTNFKSEVIDYANPYLLFYQKIN